MPLTELMAQAKYSPTDEAALARLTGITEPLDATARAINSLTEQLQRTQRECDLMRTQATLSKQAAKVWRARHDELYRRRRRDAERELISAPPPREPRSYAERMRAKRF